MSWLNPSNSYPEGFYYCDTSTCLVFIYIADTKQGECCPACGEVGTDCNDDDH